MEKNGYQIPPYRLMKMSDLAAKIVKQLTCDPTINYTKEEEHIVLDIVSDILDRRMEDECN